MRRATGNRLKPDAPAVYGDRDGVGDTKGTIDRVGLDPSDFGPLCGPPGDRTRRHLCLGSDSENELAVSGKPGFEASCGPLGQDGKASVPPLRSTLGQTLPVAKPGKNPEDQYNDSGRNGGGVPDLPRECRRGRIQRGLS